MDPVPEMKGAAGSNATVDNKPHRTFNYCKLDNGKGTLYVLHNQSSDVLWKNGKMDKICSHQDR